MNIRERKEMKQFAASRLEGKDVAKKIILIYTGLALGLAILTTAVNYILNLEIGKTGGLSNMGTRATLDTIRQVLPLVQSVVTLCLDLGFCAAMLRIARGQYVSEKTLKLGFDRFWPLLRLSIIRGLIFMGAAMGSIYLGTFVYLLTPLSASAMEVLEPLMASAATLDPAILLEGEVYGQLLTAMIPCFLLCGLISLAVLAPLWYRYRLAGYVLIDNPGQGALMCLRQSRMLMQRNRVNLYKLDLSLLYYPLVLTLVDVVAYGDLLLATLGVDLVVNDTVAYFGFYILAMVFRAAAYCFLRNKVEVTYCLAYDSLLPKEPKENAVVLGNIFQM